MPLKVELVVRTGLDNLTQPALTRAGSLGVAPSAYRIDATKWFPHRVGVTAVDKVSVPGTLTGTAQTEAGSNLANVAYGFAIAAGNRWGTTGPGAIPAQVTPAANQAMRIAFAAVAGAEYYDVFLSTSATAPLWVGRITAAQQAAGGIISAVGVYSAGGAVNSIDVGIVGTGLACTVNPFVVNNAYTPNLVAPFSCVGVSRVHALVKLAVTDLRSLPSLSIIPFFANHSSPTDWHQGALQSVSLLTAVGQSLEQDFEIDVDGAYQMVLLVDTISGQGSAASIWLEAA